VQRLFDLVRLRNEHAAFGGTFEMAESPVDTLDLSWRLGEEFAHLTVNVASCEHRLEYSSAGRVERLELGSAPAAHAERRSTRGAHTGEGPA
jgi:sucrose phosphorylase